MSVFLSPTFKDDGPKWTGALALGRGPTASGQMPTGTQESQTLAKIFWELKGGGGEGSEMGKEGDGKLVGEGKSCWGCEAEQLSLRDTVLIVSIEKKQKYSLALRKLEGRKGYSGYNSSGPD